MSTQKKKLSKNAELIITCVITMILCLIGYILSLLTIPITEEMDKRAIIINGINNLQKVLPVLSDSLSPSLIIWCIIGLISNFSKTNYLKTSIIPAAVAIPVFAIYLAWYVAYTVLKIIFYECVIANIIIFFFVLIISLLFFNEHKKK